MGAADCLCLEADRGCLVEASVNTPEIDYI